MNFAVNNHRWWERRAYVALLLLVAVIPLLWPQFPPIVDLPGHMGRFYVQLHPDDEMLARFYGFDWRYITNLGVDILIIPVAALVGIEAGTKIIMIATLALSAWGLIWISREIHGRVTPTVAIAIPFLYGYVMTYGFINFILGMAFALNAYALWMYLGRRGRTGLRFAIMIPISIIVATCHIFAWGVLGILIFGWEFAQNAEQSDRIDLKAICRWVTSAMLACVPLFAPFLLFLLSRLYGEESSAAIMSGAPELRGKIVWILSALRDQWKYFDLASIAFVFGTALIALLSRSFAFSKRLIPALALLFLVYLIFPKSVLGTFYTDMRMPPYMFALALIAIYPTENAKRGTVAAIAMLSIIFCVVRIGATTVVYVSADHENRATLKALEAIPNNARLVHFINVECDNEWSPNRKTHIGSIALLRKGAYANDQWALEGGQLIRSRINAPGYEVDGSQLLPAPSCKGIKYGDPGDILRNIPRDKFDYVWLVDVPPVNARHLAGVERLWTDGNSSVYKIVK